MQHQYNPVDWYPWGDEAFTKSKAENKPIFLSIGYSTCHWCHVMESESFENDATAEIINKYFVPIKVDREERPDVDKIYMTYVQATTGGGGWPLSAFLTPDLEPFFGGTYFPPKDSYGRPGFNTVLKRIAQVWGEKQDEIKKQSSEVMEQLGALTEAEAPSADSLTIKQQEYAVAACAESLAKRFDAKEGGFGGAPKFPRPSEIDVLLREYALLKSKGKEEDAARLLHMATFTLRKMSVGGMHDHIGGGFHRYSVDEYWHVAHFEKMLYDQPQLINSLVSAFQITRDTQYAATARDIIDYLLRDMRHPEGGFYAAEDADSLDTAANKKKEGAFYVWTADEIKQALQDDTKYKIFSAHYYIKDSGNCDLSARSDPHNEFGGKNVPIARQTIEKTAEQAGLSVGQTEELLADCRETLFHVREQRPRPHRDDKVVAAWNGLLIGALANASRTLSSEDPPVERCFPVEGVDPNQYLKAAEHAVDFVKAKLVDPKTGGLRRAFTRNMSAVVGFSDDYACLISGLLDLYAACGDVEHLKWAMELQNYLDEHFWDEQKGGYFQALQGDPSLKLRMKEDYDGAETAASSVAAANLWRLAGLAGTEQSRVLRARAQKCTAAFEERLREVPVAMPAMCCALYLLALGHPRQVIIAGKKGAHDTEALLDAANSVFSPDKVIIHLDLSDEDGMGFWRRHNPEAVAMAEGTGMTMDDPATAFICQNFTCLAPTTSPKKVEELLGKARGAAPTTVKLPF